jgi:hypothetical protein
VRRAPRRSRRWLVVAAVLVVAGEGAFLAWRHREPPLRFPALTESLLRRVDGDGDGVVSATEYGALALDDEPLAAWDKDGDGALSPSELEAQFLGDDPVALLGARHRAMFAPRLPRLPQ